VKRCFLTKHSGPDDIKGMTPPRVKEPVHTGRLLFWARNCI
jgi:hypothetical protein